MSLFLLPTDDSKTNGASQAGGSQASHHGGQANVSEELALQEFVGYVQECGQQRYSVHSAQVLLFGFIQQRGQTTDRAQIDKLNAWLVQTAIGPSQSVPDIRTQLWCEGQQPRCSSSASQASHTQAQAALDHNPRLLVSFEALSEHTANMHGSLMTQNSTPRSRPAKPARGAPTLCL